MSSTQDIRRALELRLNTGSYTGITNSTDISWENRQFDPTAKTAWLRPRLQITEVIPATADVTTTERWVGLFTIDCFVKQNTGGTAVLDDLADDVRGRFPKGTQLTENSKIISLRQTDKTGIINDPPYIFSRIAVYWYSYITP